MLDEMAKTCIEALAIGIRLKEYREERNLTRNKLGIMSGTDPKQIAKIEEGKSEGTVLWYFHIMHYYGLNLSHLFDNRYNEILIELQMETTVNES